MPESWIEFRAEPDPVDFEDPGGDLRITRGDHLYPHHNSRALFTDRLTPVCTPDVTRRVALAGQSPQDLPEESLIHTWWSPSLWAFPTWVDWFALPASPDSRAPASVRRRTCRRWRSTWPWPVWGGLGQMSLVAEAPRDSRLIAPFPARLPMPRAYCIVTPRSARRKERLATLVAALRDLAGRLEDRWRPCSFRT